MDTWNDLTWLQIREFAKVFFRGADFSFGIVPPPPRAKFQIRVLVGQFFQAVDLTSGLFEHVLHQILDGTIFSL